MRKLLLFCLFFVFSMISVASAADVVYILQNTNFADDVLIDELAEIGYTVDLFDNEDIADINFSEYKFMLLPDLSFSNNGLFPVNEFPALIINSRHMDEWNWVPNGKTSSKSSSIPLTGYVINSTHYITNGLSGDVTLYTSSTPSLSYLHRYYKAPEIETVLSTDGVGLNTLNAVIGLAYNGTALRDGVVSETTTVFFGITGTSYWTEDTKTMFKNAARYLTIDFFEPTVSNITLTGLTNTSVDISFVTDKDANYTFMYGETPEFDTNITTTAMDTNHMVSLSDLSEKTTYYFRISACNKDAVCGYTNTESFTTLDLTAPYLADREVSNITNSTALITIDSTEAGTATVYYGTSGSFDYSTGSQSLNLSTAFGLTDLSDKTEYSYFAQLCDESNNCRNSTTESFTTLDITAPKAPSNFVIYAQNGGSGVKLSWDSAADDAASYNVYVSDTANGFNYSDIHATTTENYFVDINSDLFESRYYVVRAEDSHGNEEDNTNVLGKFDVELFEGYNFISNPLPAQDSSLSNLLQQNVSYSPISQVKYFDSQNQAFVDSEYFAGSWNNSIEITPGHGFFALSSMDTTFTFVGSPEESKSITLYEGMNAIGLSSLDNSSVSSLFSSADVTEVGYRTDTGRYSLSTFDGSWSDDFTLIPGQGYWAKSNKNTTMSVTP